MINKNWYTALAFFMAYNSSYTAADFAFTDYSGLSRPMYYKNSSTYGNPPQCLMPMSYLANYFTPNTGSNYFQEQKVLLGDGDAEPTIHDYCLSGEMITTVNCVSKQHATTVQNGKYTLTNTFTIQNTGTEPITIREVAWGNRQFYTSSDTTNLIYDRTVLDEPVTIPAGELGVVVYKLELTIPTA